jgi:dipeptidyl aminopeptidase/acylaminoacyl peptidase
MKHNAKVIGLLAVMMAFLLGADSGTRALAQDAGALRHLQVDDYFALKSVGSPCISPNGAWVAYTVRTKDLENDRSETRLWMVSISGGEALPMTAKGSSVWRPRWSPDGKYLTFMASSRGQGSQVFTLDLRGGERVQLTSVKQGLEGYEWSPDGKRLVLLIRDQKPSQEEDPGPWVIDRLKFKEDYVGYLNRLRAHLYVYNLETKATVQITSGDYEDYSPAWSPDGSVIVFVSNRTEEPDANYNTDIWLVKPDIPHGEQEPVRVTSNPGSDDSPVWHPDGERLAYITTIRTDVPLAYLQTKLALIRVGEDEPVLLTTESLDRKVYDPHFAPDGRSLNVLLEDNGRVHLAAVSVEDGSLSRPIAGRRAVSGAATGPDGTIVALVSEPRLPAELFVLDAEPSTSSGLRRLTHANDELLRTIALADAEEERFPTLDGTEIQAFIYKPPSFEPGLKYPTLLWLHGGQEAQYDFGFNFRVQLFAANGYVVVMPNVRGSGGRGLDFTLSNYRAWGTHDAEDVIVATDHVLELGYADPDRLGIGGWSYGGTLTNDVITSTDRFSGAISGASVGLWTSTYGHDPYQEWFDTELGPPWENRDLWDSVSPFMEVGSITTPTLFIGGEKDWNQPIIHSEQMYQAMKQLGREVSLVVYPDAHHGIRRHSYQKDLLERFLGWFDKYVKGSKSGS